MILQLLTLLLYQVCLTSLAQHTNGFFPNVSRNWLLPDPSLNIWFKTC